MQRRLTKREELSFLKVFALPKTKTEIVRKGVVKREKAIELPNASRRGFVS